MRERLIELIDRYTEGHLENICQPYGTDGLVDFLLENGVVVSPVKAGQDVYLIPTYNSKPYCGVVSDKVQMIGITTRGIHIKARNHHDHNKMYMLGKSVFLTREEAEQALKEREKYA